MSFPKIGRTPVTGSKRPPDVLNDPRISKKTRSQDPIRAIPIENPSLFDLFNVVEDQAIKGGTPDLQGRADILQKKVIEQSIKLGEQKKKISEQINMLVEQAKLIDDLKRDIMTLKNQGAPVWLPTLLELSVAGQKNGPVLLSHNNL